MSDLSIHISEFMRPIDRDCHIAILTLRIGKVDVQSEVIVSGADVRWANSPTAVLHFVQRAFSDAAENLNEALIKLNDPEKSNE